MDQDPKPDADQPLVTVRHIQKRDLDNVWEFLKLTFRDVNRETVEYQRPRSKTRFLEVFEEDGIEQLVFEVRAEGKPEIVGYAECAFEILGSDNWMNERYFARRDMRPLYVEELAVHPGYGGRGIGTFILDQLEHLARVRGCTHLVLEVAENNDRALKFYRGRAFTKLDAALFLAKKVPVDAELLPPRAMKPLKLDADGRKPPRRPVKPAHKPKAPPRARKGAPRNEEPEGGGSGGS